MNALNVSFVRGRKPPTLVGLLLLAVGLMTVTWATLDLLDTQDALARADARRARLQAQLKPGTARARSVVAVAPVGRDDNALALRVNAQLQLPWDVVLRDLDTLASPAVSLLSVEAQGHARSLRVAGEAKSMDDVVALVAQVRQLPSVDTAYLASHEQKQSGAVNIVRFTLDASWKRKAGGMP